MLETNSKVAVLGARDVPFILKRISKEENCVMPDSYTPS